MLPGLQGCFHGCSFFVDIPLQEQQTSIVLLRVLKCSDAWAKSSLYFCVYPYEDYLHSANADHEKCNWHGRCSEKENSSDGSRPNSDVPLWLCNQWGGTIRPVLHERGVHEDQICLSSIAAISTEIDAALCVVFYHWGFAYLLLNLHRYLGFKEWKSDGHLESLIAIIPYTHPTKHIKVRYHLYFGLNLLCVKKKYIYIYM